MKLFRSLTLTFAMYSRIPMPRVEWDEKSMEWVFACFPLVGCIIGLALWLWLRLALWLHLGSLLTGGGAVVLQAALTGGIHLDGLCDTCDALGSHQSRERKLEIMKDSHIGAFGVMGCVLYLIALFAAWSELQPTQTNLILAALVPVLSRSWTSLAAVTRKNARSSGLLATFTNAANKTWNRIIALLWLAVGTAALCLIDAVGKWMALASVLVYLLCWRKTEREFGGLTGDLAGWQLSLLELAMVLAAAVAGKGAFPCA